MDESSRQERPDEVGATRHLDTLSKDLMEHVTAMLVACGHSPLMITIAAIPKGTQRCVTWTSADPDASRRLIREVQARVNASIDRSIDQHPDTDAQTVPPQERQAEPADFTTTDSFAALPVGKLKVV